MQDLPVVSLFSPFPSASRAHTKNDLSTYLEYHFLTLSECSKMRVWTHLRHYRLLQLHKSTDLQFYNSTALHLYNSTCLQIYNSITLRTALQLYSSTTLQLYLFYNSTALQLYNSTALHRHVARMQNLEGQHCFWGGGSFRRKPKMLTLIQKTPALKLYFVTNICNCVIIIQLLDETEQKYRDLSVASRSIIADAEGRGK